MSSKNLDQDRVNDGKEFPSDFTNELKLNKSYIWQIMRFDEFFIIFVLSELTIEELNHTVTTSRGSSFYSVELPLHTARRHWWIVGPTRIILMVNNFWLVSWNCFNSLKEISIIFWWRSKCFLLLDIIEPMGSHIKKDLTDRIDESWFRITKGLGLIKSWQVIEGSKRVLLDWDSRVPLDWDSVKLQLLHIIWFDQILELDPNQIKSYLI